jgi:membrane protease YdiL (CAAX protease family)
MLKKPVPLFLAFLFALTTAAYVLVIQSNHENDAISHFLMWSPAFAALCTCLMLRIPLGTLGWDWPEQRFLRLAYFLPLIYGAPVYLSTWLEVRGSFSLKGFEAAMAGAYGLGRWATWGTFAVALPMSLTITVIGACTWALGEEIGWRGFLFPRLQRWCGFHGACLTSGVLWVWHLPGLLWADHDAGATRVYAIACFTVGILAMSYIMGYLRVRSGSIWPCVLLRATHKSFVEGIFDPLTAPVGWAKHITSEFGIGIALAVVIAATIIIPIKRPGEVTSLHIEISPERPTDHYQFNGSIRTLHRPRHLRTKEKQHEMS